MEESEELDESDESDELKSEITKPTKPRASRSTSLPKPVSTSLSEPVKRKRKINEASTDINEASTDEEEGDNGVNLNSTQKLLFKKGKKLREILLDNDELTSPEKLNTSEELLKDPIIIVDETSAKDRINQWQRQQLRCENLVVSAESFNLSHLASLVQIYDDLFNLGTKKNIKNTKSWVISFMRSALNINKKAEQRNRVGCDRLRKLFKEGITSTHLAQAGCRKSDFFVKEEDYKIFLSQIPRFESQRLNSLSSLPNERFFELMSTEDTNEPNLNLS